MDRYMQIMIRFIGDAGIYSFLVAMGLFFTGGFCILGSKKSSAVWICGVIAIVAFLVISSALITGCINELLNQRTAKRNERRTKQIWKE